MPRKGHERINVRLHSQIIRREIYREFVNTINIGVFNERKRKREINYC